MPNSSSTLDCVTSSSSAAANDLRSIDTTAITDENFPSVAPLTLMDVCRYNMQVLSSSTPIQDLQWPTSTTTTSTRTLGETNSHAILSSILDRAFDIINSTEDEPWQ